MAEWPIYGAVSAARESLKNDVVKVDRDYLCCESFGLACAADFLYHRLQLFLQYPRDIEYLMGFKTCERDVWTELHLYQDVVLVTNALNQAHRALQKLIDYVDEHYNQIRLKPQEEIQVFPDELGPKIQELFAKNKRLGSGKYMTVSFLAGWLGVKEQELQVYIDSHPELFDHAPVIRMEYTKPV